MTIYQVILNHALKNGKNGKQEPNTHEGISKLEGEKNEKSSQNLKVRDELVFFSLLKFSIFTPFFQYQCQYQYQNSQKVQYQYQNQYFGDANFNINIKINILKL